jgi:hypothetical protein
MLACTTPQSEGTAQDSEPTPADSHLEPDAADSSDELVSDSTLGTDASTDTGSEAVWPDANDTGPTEIAQSDTAADETTTPDIGADATLKDNSDSPESAPDREDTAVPLDSVDDADFDVPDSLDDASDTATPETLCPAWADDFSLDYVHDPCEDLLVSPEKFQELLTVPVACPVPFSQIVEPDAVYDIWPEAEIDWWDPRSGGSTKYDGEIYDMLALPEGGVWVAYRLTEYKSVDVGDPPSSSWQDVRFRHLDNDGQSVDVVDLATPESFENVKWARMSPGGEPWFAVYSEAFFATQFGLEEPSNIIALDADGIELVYTFPKDTPLTPPDGYSIYWGYFLRDGFIGQAPATEAELSKSACYNSVIYRRDLDWNITWKTPWAVMGSEWLNKPGVWPGVPLHIEECGFVLYGNRPGKATSESIPPSTLFHIPSFHFFTEAGTHVGTRSYLAGYWGENNMRGATDGKEVVTARSIDGTIQNPTSIGQKVGVLRLEPDGSLKWFSVLWEPDGIWSSLYANSILALPSGLTIVAADVNDFFVKVFVIDPTGCVLAVYAFSGGVPGQPTGAPQGTYPSNFLHMQRLSDGRFVAHDDHRVVFFSLPAVDEWEAALAPPP